MVGGERPLKRKFSCYCEPPDSARANASHADKQRNITHIDYDVV